MKYCFKKYIPTSTLCYLIFIILKVQLVIVNFFLIIDLQPLLFLGFCFFPLVIFFFFLFIEPGLLKVIFFFFFCFWKQVEYKQCGHRILNIGLIWSNWLAQWYYGKIKTILTVDIYYKVCTRICCCCCLFLSFITIDGDRLIMFLLMAS